MAANSAAQGNQCENAFEHISAANCRQKIRERAALLRESGRVFDAYGIGTPEVLNARARKQRNSSTHVQLKILETNCPQADHL